MTKEALTAVIYEVIKEAYKAYTGDVNIGEFRNTLKEMLSDTYHDREWDEEAYKKGFYEIDEDKGGEISFEELFAVIYENAVRQGMMVEEPTF